MVKFKLYFQVQSCSYSSILASDVKKHEMRVHNIGEPPAECGICGKKVKKRKYLKKRNTNNNISLHFYDHLIYYLALLNSFTTLLHCS